MFRAPASLGRSVVLGALLGAVCIAALWWHDAHTPRPVVLRGADFYWSAALGVHAGPSPSERIVQLTLHYVGPGFARDVRYEVLVPGRAAPLFSKDVPGDVEHGAAADSGLQMVTRAPRAWENASVRLRWTGVQPGNAARGGEPTATELGLQAGAQ